MNKKLREAITDGKKIGLELRGCFLAAWKALPESSPLTDEDVYLLARIAVEDYVLTAFPTSNEEGELYEVDCSAVDEGPAKVLAWIMHRDAVGASKAIIAASKRWEAFKRTDSFWIRKVLREDHFKRGLNRALAKNGRRPIKVSKHDMQGINESVRKVFGKDVTEKSIDRAITQIQTYG